jgi:CubicO group peptidase (beta-lactamase class C family)
MTIPVEKSNNKFSVDTDKLNSIIDRAIKDSTSPSIVASVYRKGKKVFEIAAGNSASSPVIAANTSTVFDIGELTQIAVTVPLLMLMVEERRIDLNHRVSRYLPGFNVHGKSTVTIGHLLSHTSGLASDVPYFESITREHGSAGFGMLTNRGAKDFVVNTILRSSLKNPPETKQSYSDDGFILLGSIVELLTGMTLEKAAAKLLFRPLNLKSTSFIDLSLVKRKGLQPVPELVASYNYCEWRKKIIWGEVFDPNAWAMGGISGHAGLFSTVSDLQKIGQSFLAATNPTAFSNNNEVVRLFNPQVMNSFLSGGLFDIPVSYAYGFDTPSKENNLVDCGFSDKSFGLVSSTGCMFWVDPELEQVAVILANKHDSQRNNRKLSSFRQEFFHALNSFDSF